MLKGKRDCGKGEMRIPIEDKDSFKNKSSGKRKPVTLMTEREKKYARKQWREKKRKDREREREAKRALQNIHTPPSSPDQQPENREKRRQYKQSQKKSMRKKERYRNRVTENKGFVVAGIRPYTTLGEGGGGVMGKSSISPQPTPASCTRNYNPRSAKPDTGSRVYSEINMTKTKRNKRISRSAAARRNESMPRQSLKPRQYAAAMYLRDDSILESESDNESVPESDHESVPEPGHETESESN
ncbi:hypothetical protein DPMN_091938 [Dreissena polymorpha]|uniref:Uncharacterized protein n=1 Tax=Dreissena polymorpha TaxID=45954 RepID=A0A9D4L122_DREPO|nr:hypothetical protein DPMN_091938 [Dreissena polymorpha]